MGVPNGPMVAASALRGRPMEAPSGPMGPPSGLMGIPWTSRVGLWGHQGSLGVPWEPTKRYT